MTKLEEFIGENFYELAEEYLEAHPQKQDELRVFVASRCSDISILERVKSYSFRKACIMVFFQDRGEYAKFKKYATNKIHSRSDYLMECTD